MGKRQMGTLRIGSTPGECSPIAYVSTVNHTFVPFNTLRAELCLTPVGPLSNPLRRKKDRRSPGFRPMIFGLELV